jgi:hypothetical protein
MLRETRLLRYAFAVVLALGACGGDPEAPTATPAGSCTIPPETYNDLAACTGPFLFLEGGMAMDNVRTKWSAKIVIPSKDPNDILAGLGAYMREEGWTDSFIVFAYGWNDPSTEGNYNRGRLLWNFRGPITVDICTEFTHVKGVEACTDQIEFTVSNRDPALPPIPQPRRSLLGPPAARTATRLDGVAPGRSATPTHSASQRPRLGSSSCQ